jgi:hypothetical protein
MSTFAVVKDGVVIDAVIADTNEIVMDLCSRIYGSDISAHECVGDNALIGIGWTYDGATFTPPYIPPTE